MTSKKQTEPAYEPPFISYYTLRDPADEPEGVVSAIVPPVIEPAVTPKEN